MFASIANINRMIRIASRALPLLPPAAQTALILSCWPQAGPRISPKENIHRLIVGRELNLTHHIGWTNAASLHYHTMWPWNTYPTTPLESAASPVSAPIGKDGQAGYDYIIVGGD
jgi:hypothetical protein